MASFPKEINDLYLLLLFVQVDAEFDETRDLQSRTKDAWTVFQSYYRSPWWPPCRQSIPEIPLCREWALDAAFKLATQSNEAIQIRNDIWRSLPRDAFFFPEASNGWLELLGLLVREDISWTSMQALQLDPSVVSSIKSASKRVREERVWN